MYALENITLRIYTIKDSQMKKFPPREKSVQSFHSQEHTSHYKFKGPTHKLLSFQIYDVTAYKDNTNCSFSGYSITYDNQLRIFYE